MTFPWINLRFYAKFGLAGLFGPHRHTHSITHKHTQMSSIMYKMFSLRVNEISIIVVIVDE